MPEETIIEATVVQEPEAKPDGVENLLPVGEVDLPPKGPFKRTKRQREEDLVTIQDMVRQRRPQYEIAALISAKRPYTIGRSQIAYDVAELERRSRAKHIKPIPISRAVELDYLEYLEQESQAAWERSKKDAKSQKFESAAGKDGQDAGKVTREIEQRDGDPAFLRILLQIADVRARILGLYAPIKTDVLLEGEAEHKEDIKSLREAYRKHVAAQMAAAHILTNGEDANKIK